MAEQNKPFVITDRRRHTLDGDVRPDADPSPEKPKRVDPEPTPIAAAPGPVAVEAPAADEVDEYEASAGAGIPAGPTPEQIIQARMAYTQTADRLTTAIRAANPGMEHPPAMSFDGVVQSVYMTAIMQLGGSTPEGQQPQVDLMGAQQSIEMLTVLQEKTKGNATAEEVSLMERAIFELQVAFLEITQALARSAAAKQQQAQGPGFPPPPGGGPRIVR